MVDPNIEFQVQLWSQDYLVLLLQCTRYGLQNSVMLRHVHKPAFPGKQLFLVTKTQGKGQNYSGSNLINLNLFTWPTCLFAFCIYNPRKTLLSSSLQLDGRCCCHAASSENSKLKFKFKFSFFFKGRAFNLTSNLYCYWKKKIKCVLLDTMKIFCF